MNELKKFFVNGLNGVTITLALLVIILCVTVSDMATQLNAVSRIVAVQNEELTTVGDIVVDTVPVLQDIQGILESHQRILQVHQDRLNGQSHEMEAMVAHGSF